MEKFLKRENLPLINLVLLLLVCYLAYDKYNINSVVTSDNSLNEIKLVRCIDGDTSEFSKIGKTRFLLIDTPESTKKKEKYGKEASNYTCNTLKKAKKITYEYDGETKDKYNRSLAYIFVDNKLLQSEIAKQGYVKRFYIKKNYKYKYESKIRASINDKYGILTKDSILR